jgi:CBS domain containing-hemolysin-like protein
MLSIFFIFIAFFLVLLNGFFVAAEFSIVKLRHSRLEMIKHRYGFRGRILLRIHQHLDEYLSACQLGITLASLGLGWIGEPAFARLLEPLLAHIPISTKALNVVIAFAIAFFIISYLHIVVGELAPKSLAIRQVEKIALNTAVPLYLFNWLMFPLIWILNHSANFVLRLFGISTKQDEYAYSSDELKIILSASHLHDELTRDELEMLERVLDLTELKVADFMRPLSEMKAVYATEPLNKTLTIVTGYPYSRYPIYNDRDSKKILGVLHVKDLFPLLLRKTKHESILKFKRPIIEIDLQTPALELLQQFRLGLTHFALIKSEWEKYLGFVTLNDILTVILGNIRDEFGKSKRDWFETKEGAYLMYGHTPLYELEKLLKIEFLDIESNTIGGLLLEHLGRLPEVNERIEFAEFTAFVVKMRGPKIIFVKIFPKK